MGSPTDGSSLLAPDLRRLAQHRPSRPTGREERRERRRHHARGRRPGLPAPARCRRRRQSPRIVQGHRYASREEKSPPPSNAERALPVGFTWRRRGELGWRWGK